MIWVAIRLIVKSWQTRVLNGITAVTNWVRNNPMQAAWLTSVVVAFVAGIWVRNAVYVAQLVKVHKHYAEVESKRVQDAEQRAKQLEAAYYQLAATAKREVEEATDKADTAISKYKAAETRREEQEQELRNELEQLELENQQGSELYVRLKKQLAGLACNRLSVEAVAAINELEGVYQ